MWENPQELHHSLVIENKLKWIKKIQILMIFISENLEISRTLGMTETWLIPLIVVLMCSASLRSVFFCPGFLWNHLRLSPSSSKNMATSRTKLIFSFLRNESRKTESVWYFITKLNLIKTDSFLYLSVCVCVSHSVVSDSETPCTIARQAPLSMEFSRQECGSGLSFPSPGDLPDPGIEPRSPALQADSLLSKPLGKPIPI